jgi:hypothetical protein
MSRSNFSAHRRALFRQFSQCCDFLLQFARPLPRAVWPGRSVPRRPAPTSPPNARAVPPVQPVSRFPAPEHRPRRSAWAESSARSRSSRTAQRARCSASSASVAISCSQSIGAPLRLGPKLGQCHCCSRSAQRARCTASSLSAPTASVVTLPTAGLSSVLSPLNRISSGLKKPRHQGAYAAAPAIPESCPRLPAPPACSSSRLPSSLI